MPIPLAFLALHVREQPLPGGFATGPDSRPIHLPRNRSRFKKKSAAGTRHAGLCFFCCNNLFAAAAAALCSRSQLASDPAGVGGEVLDEAPHGHVDEDLALPPVLQRLVLGSAFLLKLNHV